MKQADRVSVPDHIELESQLSLAKIRAVVFERDNYQCQVCGAIRQLELHHWEHFRSGGGATTVENLVTVCHKHHQLIHDHLLDIMYMETYGGGAFFVRGSYQLRRS